MTKESKTTSDGGEQEVARRKPGCFRDALDSSHADERAQKREEALEDYRNGKRQKE